MQECAGCVDVQPNGSFRVFRDRRVALLAAQAADAGERFGGRRGARLGHGRAPARVDAVHAAYRRRPVRRERREVLPGRAERAGGGVRGRPRRVDGRRRGLDGLEPTPNGSVAVGAGATSVAWRGDGNVLAVGASDGRVVWLDSRMLGDASGRSGAGGASVLYTTAAHVGTGGVTSVRWQRAADGSAAASTAAEANTPTLMKATRHGDESRLDESRAREPRVGDAHARSPPGQPLFAVDANASDPRLEKLSTDAAPDSALDAKERARGARAELEEEGAEARRAPALGAGRGDAGGGGGGGGEADARRRADARAEDAGAEPASRGWDWGGRGRRPPGRPGDAGPG